MAITANRYLVLLLLFIAASASYAIGFVVGFWLLIALGVAFELAFWFKLFADNRRRERVRKLYENQLDELESWECSNCGEKNPSSFEVCWGCGSKHAE